jgi:phosphoserine phosphatase RsbX
VENSAIESFPPPRLLEYGLAERPLPGEQESGDLQVVQSLEHGALLAVIDGVGHGREAARAANTAAMVLLDRPDDDLTTLLENCHRALRPTRGAAIRLVSIDIRNDSITWLGVGNVQGFLTGSPEGTVTDRFMLLSDGVVGFDLPELRTTTFDLRPGSVLALATDGIRGEFTQLLDLDKSPQQLADLILSECAQESDDALIMVLHYLGTRG